MNKIIITNVSQNFVLLLSVLKNDTKTMHVEFSFRIDYANVSEINCGVIN